MDHCVDRTGLAPVGHEETMADVEYRGTSLIRNSASLGPYRRNVPRAL